MTVSVRLEPMTTERFTTYRAAIATDYGRHLAESGALPEREAMAKGEADIARLLPDGLDSEGHLLLAAYGGDAEVGLLWLHLEEKSDGLHAFGYDFSVREDLRRSGYGRAIMVAAERDCLELGVVSVGLSVFGFNLGAQELYEQMGFEVTAVQMRKRLKPGDPPWRLSPAGPDGGHCLDGGCRTRVSGMTTELQVGTGCAHQGLGGAHRRAARLALTGPSTPDAGSPPAERTGWSVSLPALRSHNPQSRSSDRTRCERRARRSGRVGGPGGRRPGHGYPGPGGTDR